MSAGRWLLGGAGVLLAGYGVLLAVTRQEPVQLVEIGAWLAGGVLLHDVVLTGLVLAVTALAARLLPRPWHAPAVVGLVVWGSVSLVAVPVIGRFGASPDNPTLLDRPYTATWLAGTVLVALAVAVAGWVRSRRGAGG